MEISDLKNSLTKKINLRKADKEAIPMTFDLANVKSTVNNPSQLFKGISVDDEQKILNYVKQNYWNSSEFEKQQAVQWLYGAALNKQKQADIDAWRQQIKLDLTYKAKNAVSDKEKNLYNSQVKKADLADLIKEQLAQQWYNKYDFMNLTDEWIIAWFLETNPEYKDSFNKYFYDKRDATQLWKDLGWIEKNTWDKIKDKVKEIWEWMAGWMPKWWEWVKDFLDLSLAWTDQYQPDRQKDLDRTAFANYVWEKYWTMPINLTDRDYQQAKKDFEANKEQNQKEFTPTYWSAFTKMAMWLTDIAFTAWGMKWPAYWEKFLTSWLGKNIVKNDLFKLWFSTLAADDNMSRLPEALWDTLSWAGSYINKLPWFREIRDSLQTEQDKADWDAFVAGNILWLLKKWSKKINQIKDADVQWWKDSYDKIKKGDIKWGVETLEQNAKENRQTKYNEQKLKIAQEVWQWEIETRESMSKWLDTLNEEWKLKNIKSVDDLWKATQESIDKLKAEQTEISKKETKKFWQSDLWLPDEVDVLDENGNKTKQAVISYPFDKLLDNIIEHYESIWNKAEVTKYKSYKNALKKGNLPAETLLEIKREGNSLNQNVYNDKTNLVKDNNKAQIWADNMKQVNEVVDWLEIWEDLRSRDAKLSSLYTLQNWIKKIKKASANYEKKMIKESTFAKWVGKTISRILSKLSFGTTNFLSKAFVSMLQESLGWGMREKSQYNALEIANKVPEFVADYEALLQKIEWNNVSKSRVVRLANEFADKWQLEIQFNEDD